MSAKLRHVDPARAAGAFARWYAATATTRMARFVSRHVSWKLDPLLLRISGGRVATTLVFPTAVLETRGARTGEFRRNAVIYFHDASAIIVVASNAGSPRHPGWYHNLRANPEVTLGGIPMLASVIDDPERCRRLWVLADRVFPAFATYRHDAARTQRTIPLVQLAPREVSGAKP
jgi:deazaflavin-dependent oxidoreductase (nitroreductase family)